MGNQATPASQWKNKRETDAGPLDLPSGNTALVRPLDPTAFVTSGWIPNPLMNMIRKSINEKKGLPPQALNKVAEDPALLGSTLEMFDRILVNVVVEPEIAMPPVCVTCGEYVNTDQHKDRQREDFHAYREGERDGNTLYADQVDLDDKVFVFQWCLGGTKDLEAFRLEQSNLVGDLSDSEDLEPEAVGASGDK